MAEIEISSEALPFEIDLFIDNAWQKINNATPPTWTKQRNEAFDVGEFVILSTHSEPIPPFTRMRIIEGAGSDQQITYWYASSSVQLNNKKEPFIYIHTVAFVEPTKILETITTGGELFTQPTTGKKKTMFDYFDILLSVNPLRTEGEQPKIKIDADVAEFLKTIEAREFTNHDNTLLEACIEGAQYIHAFPRMKNFDTLTFDFFGKESNTLEADNYFTWRKGQNPNEYCTALEMQADNVIEPTKTMWFPTQPTVNLGISVRSEETDLTLDNAELILPFGIYEIKQVKAWGFNIWQGSETTGFPLQDCTTFDKAFTLPADRILEKSAYDALSNFKAGSDSQSAHLYYTRFDNKIKGFSKQGYGEVTAVLYLRAWENCICQEYVAQHGGIPSGLKTSQGKKINYYDVKYKVEFVPVTSPRLRTEYESNDRPAEAVAFNDQSQNIIDIAALGENMKGKVARWGNKAIEKTTIYKSVADIPQCGTIQYVDGEKYVLEVQNLEFKNTYYKATNVFTKDFSRLSAYIGLEQSRREYNLPTELVQTRQLYRGEYFCAGLHKFDLVNRVSFKRNFGVFLRNAFKAAHPSWQTSGRLCTSTFATTYDQSGQNKGSFLLPTTARAVANSILFEFGFANNLSAGKRMETESGSIIGLFKNEKSASLNIPYCDKNGEVETVQLEVAADVAGFSYGDLSAINADILPLIGYGNGIPSSYVKTGVMSYNLGRRLIVKKDARNSLAFNVQMHYCSIDNLIVGQGLIKYNALINEQAPTLLRCVVFDDELNILQNGVQPTASQHEINFTLTYDDSDADFAKYNLAFTALTNGKAWGLLDENNMLIIGCNEAIEPKSYNRSIYFAETAVRPK